MLVSVTFLGIERKTEVFFLLAVCLLAWKLSGGPEREMNIAESASGRYMRPHGLSLPQSFRYICVQEGVSMSDHHD